MHSLRQRTLVLHASGGVRTVGATVDFDRHPGRPARCERGDLRRAAGGVLEVSTHLGAVSVHLDAFSVEHRGGPVGGRDRERPELLHHSRQRPRHHRRRQRASPLRALLLIHRGRIAIELLGDQERDLDVGRDRDQRGSVAPRRTAISDASSVRRGDDPERRPGHAAAAAHPHGGLHRYLEHSAGRTGDVAGLGALHLEASGLRPVSRLSLLRLWRPSAVADPGAGDRSIGVGLRPGQTVRSARHRDPAR